MTQREQMNILRELRTQRTKVKNAIKSLTDGTHTVLSEHGIKLLHQEVDMLTAEIDAVASEKVTGALIKLPQPPWGGGRTGVRLETVGLAEKGTSTR